MKEYVLIKKKYRKKSPFLYAFGSILAYVGVIGVLVALAFGLFFVLLAFFVAIVGLVLNRIGAQEGG